MFCAGSILGGTLLDRVCMYQYKYILFGRHATTFWKRSLGPLLYCPNQALLHDHTATGPKSANSPHRLTMRERLCRPCRSRIKRENRGINFEQLKKILVFVKKRCDKEDAWTETEGAPRGEHLVRGLFLTSGGAPKKALPRRFPTRDGFIGQVLR